MKWVLLNVVSQWTIPKSHFEVKQIAGISTSNNNPTFSIHIEAEYLVMSHTISGFLKKKSM